MNWWFGCGQPYCETTARVGLTVHFDLSAVLLHNAVADGETETGALADGPSGEEGVENMGQHLGVDATAFVTDADFDSAGVAQAARHCEDTAVGHGLTGVEDQVGEDLLEEGWIADDGRNQGVEDRGEDNLVLPNLVFKQGKGCSEDFVDLHGLAALAAWLGERQEAVNDQGRTSGGAVDAGEAGSNQLRIVGMTLGQLGAR